MRVYLPLLESDLTQVAADGMLPERTGYAVTDEVRALDPAADEEDLEFEAMCQALDAARALGAGRRVIASADVDQARGSGTDAALAGLLHVPVTDVVSFHVEESAGEVGSGYDDLLWYDFTELSALV